MSKIQYSTFKKQQGITLIGLIMAIAVIIVLAMIAMKVVPTMIEYNSITKAMNNAKNGATPREIQISFDKQREVGYFDAVTAKDLVIVKNNDGGFDLNFSYSKKIPLVGPASILMEYSGTTAKNGVVVTKPARAD
ncbi:DUF4845 domain-containing protein [Undibacterium sp. Ji83W]|uniref:DUF4845 domain-containing protein n=1 Tax=Undibacterium sp. Ji83W TaxID=3413043 RepID=UPI003BF143D7